jgi:hypothetical protein
MRIVRLLVLSLLVASVAEAGPLTAKLTDGPGTTGGGEFNLTLYDGGSPIETFITFCLQRTQYIDFTTTFNVNSISTATDDAAGPDTLDPQTAFLYTMMRSGSLPGYDHSAAAANALQKSIWYFEGEWTSNPDLEAGNDYDYVKLANDAVNSGAWSGLGDVRVLNIFYPNGGKAQDQLYLVPEPTTLAMMGMGAAVAVFRRRRVTRE